MSIKSRKRSSAFEDFPQNDTGSSDISVENDVPSMRPVTRPQPVSIERIERLPPSQMMPDRFQPRRLLPQSLRRDFYSKKTDCYETARRWLELGKNNTKYQGAIDALVNMGGTFQEHGQIKPITGHWVGQPDSDYIFKIETGERRFWAACINHVVNKTSTEPILRVEVVKQPTRQRQVLENRHAEPPSAVGQACEIASLILAELNIDPDITANDEYDYFRQVRNMRMPAGMWNKLIPLMQLSRVRMVQLLNILDLPNSLLETADVQKVPERVLREILALPTQEWEPALNAAITNGLTSLDISELSGTHAKADKKKTGRSSFLPPAKLASSGLRRFARSLGSLDKKEKSEALDEIANEIFVAGDADDFLNLLGELSLIIKARVSRK